MRLFAAIRHATNPREYYSGLWSSNFYPALRELGHEIVESQVDLLPASRFMHIADEFTAAELALRGQLTEAIIDEVRQAHKNGGIDLFLAYFYNSHFDPAGFDEIRRLGVPSVNFYCNSIYQFDLVRSIANKVDFSWHAEKHARDAYLAAGARPVWVQMAADPALYSPRHGIQRETKACFVGQRYADRDRWLAALVRAGVPVDVFGSGWLPRSSARSADPRATVYLGRRQVRAGSLESYVRKFGAAVAQEGAVGGITWAVRQWQYRLETRRLAEVIRPHAHAPVSFEEYVRIYSAYEISLSFSNVWADGAAGSALIPHVRLRDFEAPMCRSCYLTGDSDEIAEFYEIGREIDTYRDTDELIDKTRFYLGNPGAAERLREAGYRRATRDHTWVRRFQQLFSEIGLPTTAAC
jgi:glycosyltransferase involved in cell wall biosynthesis